MNDTKRCFDLGAFKLDLLSMGKFSHFFLSHMQQFPSPVCRGKDTLQWSPKVNKTMGCSGPGVFKLDHLQSKLSIFHG